MTSLPVDRTLPVHVGAEGGGCGNPAALEIPDADVGILLALQWSAFCDACERDCTFAAYGVGPNGLLVECTGCGVPREVPFSRMNSEAA